MKIDNPVRFNQLLWNLLLFTPKVGVTEGKVMMGWSEIGCWGMASDGFITITDEVNNTDYDPQTVDDQWQFDVSLDDLKSLEKWTRDVEGPISIVDYTEESDETRLFNLSTSDGGMIEIEGFNPNYRLWESLEDFVDDSMCFSTSPPGEWVTWAINPDRLKQLPRLKVEGDNPLDFRMVETQDSPSWFWQFKYGPSLVGAVMPMDRNRLRERECVLWD